MNGLDETAPYVSCDAVVERPRMFLAQDFVAETRRPLLHVAPPSNLSPIIEAEIIPRLVMAHGRSGQPEVLQRPQPDGSEPARFAHLVLGAESDDAARCIQGHRDRGVALETIYLNLLVPAARHLRLLWMNDEWDFADVTLGFWRMQRLLRDFSPAFCAEASARSVGLRALLAPAPDENRDVGHVIFGLVLASEFLRRDGWDAWIEPDSAAAPLIDTVRTQWFDVVEFFSNSDRKLDSLAANIRAVRRESPNRDIGIMVGGSAFTDRPELVFLVGGDAAVPAFGQEASQARSVVTLLTTQR